MSTINCTTEEVADLIAYLLKVANPDRVEKDCVDIAIAEEVFRITIELLKMYYPADARIWLTSSNSFLGTRPVDAIALHKFEDVHEAINAEAAGSFE